MKKNSWHERKILSHNAAQALQQSNEAIIERMHHGTVKIAYNR
jgi:hypothetical protein